ncbi:hypothetical protein [Porphyrobacter sp. GA68]|uniref:hypothetical protein n=1 Tax=Porphyrobacter sp. GA68 TaxID=2883480 RepID=UPI001D191045|nr:hypothetical protein [Porphyrobacter sp. GA68]
MTGVKLKPAVLAALVWAGLTYAPAAAAQQFPIEPEPLAQSQEEGLGDLGRTAEVGGVRIGERQAAAQRRTGRSPTARLQNRVPGRLENRLRSRIDENYDPAADAAAPFRQREREAQRVSGRPPQQ